MNIVTNSQDLARLKHKDQKRLHSEVLYITHPANVVEILKRWGMDNDNIIAAAWLHDTLEDTDITEDEIIKTTNEYVLSLVKELTYDKKLYSNKDEYIMAIATRGSFETNIIKLADRIHNTSDFISQGDIKYAKKYFNKIEPIYIRIVNSNNHLTRCTNIINRINEDYNKIKEILNE